jgi:CRISPR type I-E-associated protein CasB/Cse2
MKAAGVEFGAGDCSSERYLRLALIVGVLAERRGTQSFPSSFMHAVGGSPDAGDRKLSPLRFQSLMTALDKGSGEEKMRTLRRAMTMAADKDFNLQSFARDLLYWSDNARIDWTFDYFGKHHQSVTAKAETQSTDSEEQSQ